MALLVGQLTKAIYIGMAPSCLILDAVGIGTEGKGPSLDPRRCHERHSLGHIENLQE